MLSFKPHTAVRSLSRSLVRIAVCVAFFGFAAAPAAADTDSFFANAFKDSDSGNWRKPSRGSKPAMKLGGLGGALSTSVGDYAAPTRNTVHIKHSPGGATSDAFALTSSSLVIDGACLSSCTWAFVLNKHACFTSNARFAFHRSSNTATGQVDAFTTAYMIESVRPALRSRAREVLYTPNLVPVSAADMRAAYPDRACGSAKA
jgi:hypothetical protein